MKKKMALFDIDYTLFNTKVFKKSKLQKHLAYEEVYDVLNEISKIAKIGIFSEGQVEFQKNKLAKTKIEKYFQQEHLHIVEEKEKKIGKILRKYKNYVVYLIDDKLTILHKAKTIMPSIFTIWVKRGMYAKTQRPIENFVPDAIIKNLKELMSIIISNN